MSDAIVMTPVPRSMMMRKPPHGSPCNRCGACCYVMLCKLGRHVFGNRPGPCPALLMEDNRAACGLMEPSESRLGTAASVLIGAGDGCDARFNGEQPDPRAYEKWDRLDALRAEEIKAARALWKMED